MPITRSLPLLLCLLCAGPLAAQIPLTVDTAQGQLRGVAASNQLRVFRGIPFAAAPVGENRWRAPQPVEPWTGVRDATAFSPRCMQRGGDAATMSEDCLYLNVWSAAPSAEAMQPVIVWIHGGGFTGGTGSNPAYDGAALTRQGAVLVTFNYRLGPFGFFAHPELTTEAGERRSGNYAPQDMIAVLEWVYENIAAFGGDPINVTIVGSSAGAQSVATLLASPRAAGLFHRAIAQSGGWMGLSQGILPTLSEREALGTADAQAAGATTLAALRALPAATVLDKFRAGGIITDGYVLARDPSLIYAAGEQQPVDVLAGSNADEAVFFNNGPTTLQELRDYAANKYGELAEEFLQLYPASADADARGAYQRAFTEELAWQVRRLAAYQGTRGLGAYVYRFTRVPPGEARGATHTMEQAYMFNQSETHPQWQDADRALGDTMARYWVNFAASTNPNRQGVPAWPPYRGPELGNVMVLGDSIAPETTQIPSKQVLEFFDKAHARLLQQLEAAQ